MKKGTFFFAALVMLLIASCSGKKAPDLQATPVAADIAAPNVDHAGPMHNPEAAGLKVNEREPLMTKEGLPKDHVCMVNNAYMGKKQYPVQFEDKLYYGCCEMCVEKIKGDPTVRVAMDPLTGKEVDKSLAFITLAPGSINGGVLYFESEENYNKFINKSQNN